MPSDGFVLKKCTEPWLARKLAETSSHFSGRSHSVSTWDEACVGGLLDVKKKVPKYAQAQYRTCGVHNNPAVMLIPTIQVSSY